MIQMLFWVWSKIVSQSNPKEVFYLPHTTQCIQSHRPPWLGHRPRQADPHISKHAWSSALATLAGAHAIVAHVCDMRMRVTRAIHRPGSASRDVAPHDASRACCGVRALAASHPSPVFIGAAISRSSIFSSSYSFYNCP